MLAAETAIGDYPVECVSMINKIIRGFKHTDVSGDGVYALDAVSMLVEPHGGWLVHREAGPDDLATLEDLPRLVVSEKDLMDCEQIGYGTYSPLTGFMDRETLDAVLDDYRLPSGDVWTLPLLLPVDPETPTPFGRG